MTSHNRWELVAAFPIPNATDLHQSFRCEVGFGRKKAPPECPQTGPDLLWSWVTTPVCSAFHALWKPARVEALPVAPTCSPLWWGTRRQPKWPATQIAKGLRRLRRKLVNRSFSLHGDAHCCGQYPRPARTCVGIGTGNGPLWVGRHPKVTACRSRLEQHSSHQSSVGPTDQPSDVAVRAVQGSATEPWVMGQKGPGLPIAGVRHA